MQKLTLLPKLFLFHKLQLMSAVKNHLPMLFHRIIGNVHFTVSDWMFVFFPQRTQEWVSQFQVSVLYINLISSFFTNEIPEFYKEGGSAAPAGWVTESNSIHTQMHSFHPCPCQGIHVRLLVYLSTKQSTWCGAPMAAGMASNQGTQMSQGQPHIFSTLSLKQRKLCEMNKLLHTS